MSKRRELPRIPSKVTVGNSAVIYCRVSDDKQIKEGDGLNSQETRCREYAVRKGYEVLTVFKDDIPGYRAQRPAMKALLAFLQSQKRAGLVVIIDDISRLARDVDVHKMLRVSIAGAGGRLESPSIQFGEDADSIFFEHLMASVAQHQSQKNGEQVLNRMRARVMNGFNVFQKPTGYIYVQSEHGGGKILVRDEPVASVVAEALEGFASGRFETQADLARVLQDNPLFPKDRTGLVRRQRVGVLLRNCVYAGYVEAPDWGVTRRLGKHEPLISYETYERIQARLDGIDRKPSRPNLNEDFPLRGFVECADCGSPLSSCWSTGRNARYPYYLCQHRECVSYGKSIKREIIEREFEELLLSVRPAEAVFSVASRMFSELWDHKISQAKAQSVALKRELQKVEADISQFLDRILKTDVPSVIGAYEQKIKQLEEKRLLVKERLASDSRPVSKFEDTLRTALEFLSNPCILWRSDKLGDRRAALKLTFSDRLRYKAKEGFRTASLSLPFNMMNGALAGVEGMVDALGLEPRTR